MINPPHYVRVRVTLAYLSSNNKDIVEIHSTLISLFVYKSMI